MHTLSIINNYSNPKFNTRALDASRVSMPKLNSDKDDEGITTLTLLLIQKATTRVK